MRVLEFTVLYALVGAAFAVVVVRLRGLRAALVEVPLVLLFWPLYGPFLLGGRGGAADPGGAEEQRFIDALEGIAGTPLANLLPDRQTVRILSGRVRQAALRIVEIDRLLTQPEFSEADAHARHEAFTRRGDERGATAAQSRAQNIARMRQLRERFSRELEEVRELLGQLRVQAEVVRLSGAADAGSKELVTEILSRVEGLDAVLGDA